jgi:anti-sigma factor RsiW
MDCKRDGEEISAYLDGELDAAARTELESHLDSCAACRAQLAAQKKLGDMFAALPEVTPSGDFEARFWARVAREADGEPSLAERVRAYFSPPRMLALAGALAAALVFALALPRSTTTESPGETAAVRKVADPDVKIVRSARDFELMRDPDMDTIADVDVLEAWDDGSPG